MWQKELLKHEVTELKKSFKFSILLEIKQPHGIMFSCKLVMQVWSLLMSTAH